MNGKLISTRPLNIVAYAKLVERAQTESDSQRDREAIEKLYELWRSDVSVQYISLSLADEADALAVLRLEQRGLIHIQDVSEYNTDQFYLKLVISPILFAFAYKVWEAADDDRH